MASSWKARRKREGGWLSDCWDYFLAKGLMGSVPPSTLSLHCLHSVHDCIFPQHLKAAGELILVLALLLTAPSVHEGFLKIIYMHV